MLILLSGVSGVGKNTVIANLLKRRKNLSFMLSGTTRPRRNSEKDANYIYMSKEEFARREKNGEFFETQEVHGNMYGVLKASLLKVSEDKERDYIKDIDVYGNKKVRQFLKGKAKVLSIFLDAPDEILRERLKGRGEEEGRIKVRLSRAEEERSFKSDYDAVIENIDLEKTITKIVELIEKNK